MASPAVTPSAPAAAPSAPATPSAPSSSPATSPAPPSPPISTPESPKPPVSAPGGAQADAPKAPYDPKTAPAPPKATDYDNTTDAQARFATDLNRWHREHPEGEKPAEAPSAQTPEQQALAESQPADAPKPVAAPEVAPTPAALAKMLEDKPAFKEFMEANQDIKGPIFKMARELAEAAPIRAIFPTEGDAKFAQEYAGNMVGLKTGSLRLVNNPESAPQFLELFDSQFQQVGADGKPILDAQGKPVYDPDRNAVRNAIFNSRMQEVAQPLVSEMADLKTKLAGNYPSDSARAADQKRLDNLEYAQTALTAVEAILDGSFFEAGPPELPADATPEQKAWFEGEQKKIADQRKELEDKQKGMSKEERTQASQQFQTSVRNDMGTVAGDVIRNALQQAIDSGVYIPKFYLQEKYRDANGKETETAAIAARLFIEFEKELHKPGSRSLMEMAQHELLPQNEQTKAIRKTWYARKAAELLPGPDGLVQKEIDRIQGLVQLDQKDLAERNKKRNEVAQPEPATGGGSLPQNASREQILQAAEEAAKKWTKDHGEDWDTLPGNEKQARAVTQANRMMRK
jgi:hypothetical protein